MTIYRKLKPFTYGEYLVLGELGSGLSGKVYLAQRTSDGLFVALKRLHRSADNVIRDYFLNEQRLLRKTQHPHLVRYVESGSHGGENFLVTHFVEGTALDKLVGKPLPPIAVLHIVTQLATALDYLHQHHPDHPVIHCDVNPRNVILNERGMVVLLDFSSARTRFFAPAEDAAMLSPRYCAPEQLAQQPTTHSDQFALAAIAFELLMGNPLFASERRRKALKPSDDGPEFGDMRLILPAHLYDTAPFFNRALHQDPTQRFPSCTAAVERLGEIVRQIAPSNESGRETLLQHINQRDTRRQRNVYSQVALSIGGLAVAAAVLLGMGNIAPWQWSTSSSSSQGTTVIESATVQPTATLVTTTVPVYAQPTATIVATTVPTDTEPAGVLDQVAQARADLRSGQIEAVFDYGDGTSATISATFDRGDTSVSPCIQMTTTDQSPYGTQTLSRITIGDEMWERRDDAAWAQLASAIAVETQLQHLLPRAAATANPTIETDDDRTVVHWYDPHREAEVQVSLNGDGIPQELREIRQDNQAVVTVSYQAWNTPIEIVPPGTSE
ncbi:MAG: hypothetical protein GFH27_549309n101 [Chloroflexi bacterium AL-W]|nr:hypothetical protein [Chloroflexi bacterium AL-N1]NOK69803.1 hypothetical protein [Chloroflexi bacterium AL-N10]NOK73593.1 hypothetical protein [Chloroflexi bacterium AL-N5]NOK83973.1 hypothetical protein [Chloroflexi bacterium AL-W]NOK87924.1 hypothetical protein [Chloroflexi bacterium AL-N15]